MHIAPGRTDCSEQRRPIYQRDAVDIRYALTFNKFDKKSGCFDALSNYFSTMYSLLARFCLYACAILLFLGCRKRNEDSVSPVIQLEIPTTGATFYYLNNIPIRASIKDDMQLVSVTIEITNAQNIRFLESETFGPDNKTFDLSYNISHNDVYLTSGTYYVKITANDGENESIAFREIQLIEAPRILERIFIVRNNGSATTIDSLYNNTLFPCFNFNQTYLFGGIDSRSQQAVISSNDVSSMESFSFPDFEILNTAFPLSNEIVTAFYHDKDQHTFLWGTNQGNIWKTTPNGTFLFATTTNAPVLTIGSHSNYIIAASQAVNDNYIYVIRKDNGVIETALPFSWALKGIVELDSENNRALLIGNEGNSSYFVWLNISTAAFNEVYSFYNDSPVQSACDGGGNNFYVVHENGLTLYSNLLASYSTNEQLIPDKLIYDELNQALWAVEQNQLLLLDESGMTTTQTIAAPGMKDLWLKYNK